MPGRGGGGDGARPKQIDPPGEEKTRYFQEELGSGIAPGEFSVWSSLFWAVSPPAVLCMFDVVSFPMFSLWPAANKVVHPFRLWRGVPCVLQAFCHKIWALPQLESPHFGRFEEAS